MYYINRFSKNGIIIRCIIVLISFVVTLLLFQSQVLQNLELGSINLRFIFRGEKEPENNIIIIGIDDNSIQELGNFPWSRSLYSELINKLGKNPKIIAFDIYFDTETNEVDDKKFEELLKKDKRIILSAFYTSVDDPRFGSIKRLFLPIDKFLKNTKVGLVNPEYDSDGFIRRFQLKNLVLEKEWISFPFLVILEYLSQTSDEYISKTKLFTDRKNNIYINYRGGPFRYPVYSFVDILKGNIDPNVFKNKIILIGAVTETLHDTHFTPFYGFRRYGSSIRLGKMPGVEVHANAIATLISKDFIRPFNEGSPLYIITLFMSFIPTIFFIRKYKVIFIFVISIIFSLLYLTIANLFFVYFNTLLPYYIPVFGLLISYLFNIIHEIIKTEQEKREIKTLFQRFVSPEVVEMLLKTDRDKIFTTKREKISVMFADIRNFTYYSDIREPEEIIKILDDFLKSSSDIILKNNGTVDKFMGDAIMAIFGAPYPLENTAEKAVLSALEIQQKIKELQSEWKSKGYPSFEVGIGISSGEALVGIIGPKQKIEYTAIGNTVNLASRLEGLAKGGEILICEQTYNEIKDKFVIEDLGFFNIKGKEKPVHVFRVLGYKNEN